MKKLHKSKTLSLLLALALVAMNLVAITPAFAKAGKSSPPSVIDLNDPAASNVETTLTLGDGITLVKVTCGATTLADTTEYTFDPLTGAVVIFADTVKTLAAGKTGTKTFIFDLSSGTDPKLKVKVINTAPKVAPKTPTFTYNPTTLGRDVLFTLSTADGFTGDVYNNGTLLDKSDYQVSGKKVSISREYLGKQPVGTSTLTFDYEFGFDPTANIKIKKTPTVSAIAAIPEITVANGTALSDIGLPAQVQITTGNGTTALVDVTWDGGTPAYNAATAGDYIFSGTITLPAGITNPNNLMASVKVTVNNPITVTAIAAIPDITVANGTALGDAGLPAQVQITGDDGSTTLVDVTWEGGTPAYNATTAGDYIFSGTITLPAGIINPGNLTASVKVTVNA